MSAEDHSWLEDEPFKAPFFRSAMLFAFALLLPGATAAETPVSWTDGPPQGPSDQAAAPTLPWKCLIAAWTSKMKVSTGSSLVGDAFVNHCAA